MKRNLKRLGPALIMFIAGTTTAHGSGFAIFTQGASALGKGNAAVAHADDPSAIFYNPALINKLKGTQISIGTTALISSRRFKSSETGRITESEKTFFPSTLYVTHAVNNELSAGLGVFSPFGLGTDWDGNWEGRFISTVSEMQTFTINPVVSYRVLPNVSVAAGPDFLFLDATLEKKVKLSPLPDASQKFEGDGTGIGYNIGISYDVTPDISLGASYRSEIEVDVEGDASFLVPAGVPQIVAAQLANSRGTTSFTLPRQVQGGISYRGIPALQLEAGIRWEGWSSFKQLQVLLHDGRSMTTIRNWKDTFSYNIGGRYQLSERTALLAGYLYGGTPVPEDTFDPSIPDAPTHVFSAGTDLDYNKFKISLAYAYQMLEGRNKNNSIGDAAPPTPTSAVDRANGKYETGLHMLAVNAVFRF
ncbi:OmpP1/FadL family transporter [Geobacter sp. DSM 9736]|uniref:OmpP1/FadL family transporter n=1 Tax=Geobacter sp. DSM 9736 TaxID=1277350 RepID=UPI000B501160|nr:outer membrane protein transport protein [Geobacter sp. DSM 9736]SNB47743.1 long-chain fatty acid transport protein [Geobacter sp. DSM 9736]